MAAAIIQLYKVLSCGRQAFNVRIHRSEFGSKTGPKLQFQEQDFSSV